MTDDLANDHQAELRLLYQITVSDLAYFKTQQWSITNYAFLLLAGVAGLRQLLGSNIHDWERYGLCGLVATVAISGFIMLQKLQDSIRVRQSRLDATREMLSPIFDKAWATEVKGPEYFHSIWFLHGAIALGAIIVGWIILRISGLTST